VGDPGDEATGEKGLSTRRKIGWACTKNNGWRRGAEAVLAMTPGHEGKDLPPLGTQTRMGGQRREGPLKVKRYGVRGAWGAGGRGKLWTRTSGGEQIGMERGQKKTGSKKTERQGD